MIDRYEDQPASTLVTYEVDNGPDADPATIHHFCSPECRAQSPLTEHYGTRPWPFVPHDTRCEGCGRLIFES